MDPTAAEGGSVDGGGGLANAAAAASNAAVASNAVLAFSAFSACTLGQRKTVKVKKVLVYANDHRTV